MTRWPVYIWGPMHQDAGEVLRPRQKVSWDVALIDGVAAGWPSAILVDTEVEIARCDGPGREVLLARTPDLEVCRGGLSPAGARFRIHALLEADFFNPPLSTPVVGTIRAIYLATPPPPDSERGAYRGSPGKEWQLIALNEAPASLGALRTRPDTGVLIELELVTQPPPPLREMTRPRAAVGAPSARRV